MSKDWTDEELQAASDAMAAAGLPSFEEFSAMFETEDAKKKIEAFAKVQTDGIRFCPRCGRMTVKDRLHTNAWSRHADVYICDACGTDEAMRDFARCPLPATEWAIAQLPHTPGGSGA